jgi:hypothetical protein
MTQCLSLLWWLFAYAQHMAAQGMLCVQLLSFCRGFTREQQYVVNVAQVVGLEIELQGMVVCSVQCMNQRAVSVTIVLG